MPSLRSHIFRLYLKRFKGRVFIGESFQEQRVKINEFTRRNLRLPANVSVHAVMAAGVPAEWIEPLGADAGRVILYLHGGGYVLCSPDTHRGLAARLARASAARLLLLDYRLAPEHPFPAALDDALSAYRWLLKEGFSASRIAIGGDSAGGGLTLATSACLRDSGEPLPAALFCISPWTDLTFSGESIRTRADTDPLLSPHGGHLVKDYAGENNPANPLISPLFADLRGFPPTFIHVGNDEILLSDSTRLKDRMQAAGVDVSLVIWAGMWHVFPVFAPFIPEAQKAIDQIAAHIRAHTP
jgi:acetyl esterase/lipase